LSSQGYLADGKGETEATEGVCCDYAITARWCSKTKTLILEVQNGGSIEKRYIPTVNADKLEHRVLDANDLSSIAWFV
jgi:hypothetical protein